MGDENYIDQKKIKIGDREAFGGSIEIDRNLIEDREARGLELIEPEEEDALMDKSVGDEQYEEPDLLD